ncbi:phenylalanine--tRNA ligase subunit beta [Corynebacterium sp. NML140438]|uniref:phenylalanine--tRNA ligase subunit beta n=1 Tax=Corynebacterium sp. NML140438 TaxID=1906334 RepID=UPI0008FB9AF3|nr:phenylalanine--tRNA ligase subunit beta [Corynebacterium sp. NML140438]OIR42148.1 phenylalanine--tRNA ligase subunit beta [Corynebacterium sp. NML140438]
MLISKSFLTNLLQHAGNAGWSVTDEEMDAGFVRVGFETEGYAPIQKTDGPLVLGKVLEIEELTEFKKPIRYCQVDVGQANGTGEPQGIICGARNFAVGDTVVVALPGCVLPGDFAISARETYGHISNGMMASAAELGLTAKSAGIITLSDDAGTPGTDAQDVLDLDDTVFEVNVTPDRGYALSARGLMRELASAFDIAFTDPAQQPGIAGIDVSAVPAPSGSLIDVAVEPDTETKRFGLRKVEGIDPKATSPFWMQRELMLSGIRPVNGATDVTNFVMLLLGQPMHAFDASKISGALRIHNAEDGTKFETLDHTTRTLRASDVVISDDSGIQSLAGVMGGTLSEISDTTTDVYFEAATWDELTVARTARHHKLSSEASRRFERGVDPALVEVSLDIACALLTSFAGGKVIEGRTLVGDVKPRTAITMPKSFPSTLVGVEYSDETVTKRLHEVGCDVEPSGDNFIVTPPSWRNDLTVPVELVEEIVRLEGLDAIPSILPTPKGGRGLTASQKRRRAVTHALAYSGYAEIIPTPFMSSNIFDAWGLSKDDARRNTVPVQNPLDSDYAELATTLLPAMLEAVAKNAARGQHDVSIYSVAQVAIGGEAETPMPSVEQRPDENTLAKVINSLPKQPLHVATVGVGNAEVEGPWGDARAYTWEDAIESAQIVARTAGAELEVRAVDYLPWHPGRCAELLVEGQVVGHAGELHPQLLEENGLPTRTCAMEMDLSALPLTSQLPAPKLSAYPAVHQDLALVVDETTPAESVRKVVTEHAGPLLETVTLFDVYRSESLGEGKKSLAFGLLFRANDRTLTEDEASEGRLAAAEAAKQEFNATMRA